MLRALFLLLTIFTSPVLAADDELLRAEPYLSIWEDRTARAEFDQLDDARFVPATAKLLNAGYTSSAIWLRFDLRNSSSLPIERYFELELDGITRYEVYLRGQSQAIQSGGLLLGWNPDSEHRHPIVNVSLPPQGHGVWYIRLQSNYSLCIIAWLHSAASLAAKESREAIALGTYTGLIVFALMISLYLFFITRHSAFLYYSFVLASYHLGFQLTNFGLTWIHLWPNSSYWADRATLMFIELGNIAGIAFIRPSLDLKLNLPQINRWLWIPVLKSFICVVWGFIDLTPQLVSFSVQCTAVLLVFYYGLGTHLWQKGYSPARYFSVAWLMICVSIVLNIMQSADLVHFEQAWLRSAIRFELMLLSCALQAMLLAIAIGNQFQQEHKVHEQEYEARQKLEKSLDDAHIVQEAFIPHDLKVRSFEIITSHHPSARIGGDWLGYHHDSEHKRLILAVSDVTGHGLPAALLSGAIHGAFHGLSKTEELNGLSGPELVMMLMQRVNDVVCMTATNTSLLATMVILAIDLENGRMDYINAGHTPVVLVRNNHPEYILQGGSPLGLNQQPSFGAGHYQSQPGDMLFLYTDGLLDNKQSLRRLQLHHISQLLTAHEPLSTIQERLDDLTKPELATFEDDSSYMICRLECV